MKSTPLMIRGLFGLLSAGIIATPGTSAFGAVRTWTGGGGTNAWSNADNWMGNVAPASGDDIIFATAGNVPYLVDNVNDRAAGFLYNNISHTVNSAVRIIGNRFSLGGGIINNGSTTLTIRAGITLTEGMHSFDHSQVIALEANANSDVTLTGLGGITKTGAGRLTIFNGSVNNNFTGGFVIEEGIVQVGSGSSHGTVLGRGSVTVQASGTVTLNQKNVEMYGLNGAGLFTNQTTGNAGVTVNTSLTDNVFSGVIANTSGTVAVTKAGSGALYLSGTSSSYIGVTSVKGGTLQVAKLADGGSASSIGQSTSLASNLVIDGGVLKYTGSGDSSNRLFTIEGGGATLDASGVGALSLNATGSLAMGTAFNIARTLVLTGSNTGNNTLAAVISDGPTNGGGTAQTSVTKSGTGTWVLNGVSTYTGETLVTEGNLVVNGSIAQSAGVTLHSGARLSGHGTVSSIAGSGTVSAGNSPGILTASSVDGRDGLDFYFKFTAEAVGGVSAPVFANSAASGNDLLRLQGSTPFAYDLDSSNTITLDFSSLTLEIGEVYQGAFYTDEGDFLQRFADANLVYLGLGSFTMSVSTLQVDADFGQGGVGYITQFTVVPEPSSIALAGGILLGVAIGWRRSRKQA